MKKKDNFLSEFERVQHSIESGKTPVYSEMRSVKTCLLELLPSLVIQSILLVISTNIVSRLQVDNMTSMVVLLVANTTTQTLSFSILSILKHFLRTKKLKKYGIEVNERNIAVLESMEYQSV